MKFTDTVFKSLKDRKAITVESNGIFIPSTLPGIAKSWWTKLLNPFVKVENKIATVDAAIEAHEKQIMEANAFAERNKNSKSVAVVPFVEKSIATLENNLERLQNEKMKLEDSKKFKKIKEEEKLASYKAEYKLSTKETKAIAKIFANVPEGQKVGVEDILASKAAGKLGIPEGDFIKAVGNLNDEKQQNSNYNVFIPPILNVKIGSNYDDGRELQQTLAPQVNEAISADNANPLDELSLEIRNNRDNATKVKELVEELAKERLDNETLVEQNRELTKRVDEIKEIEKERDELRFSNKNFSDTIAKMDDDIKGHLLKIKELQETTGASIKKADAAETKATTAERNSHELEQKLLISEQEKNNVIAPAASLAAKISQLCAQNGWETTKYFPEVAILINANQQKEEAQQTK